jgi:hypothetical protein
LEAEADFVGGFGTDGPSDFDAVLEKDGGRPEFYAKGAAEGAAGAVFDCDMLDRRELGECFGDVGGRGLAVATPGGAEFEDHRAASGVDFFAGWAGVEIIFRHCAISKSLLGRGGGRASPGNMLL